MFSAIKNWLLGIDLSESARYERKKLFFLTLAFFFVIAAYTIVQGAKDAIFMGIVGREYQPLAKWLSMFVLIPPLLFYSRLVDSMRRYQLLVVYSVVFGVLGLIMAFFLGHATIGLANTDSSPYRYFGWMFYFFIEGYSPFVVSVMWAFANSINDPKSARNSYGTMVAGSKLGGILGALLPWILFSAYDHVAVPIKMHVLNHQIIFVASSLCLFMIPVVIHFMMKRIPGHYLHGYEAAYRLEKEKKKKGTGKTGILDGLFLLLKYPYVLGIFSMVYFYEVLNTVLGYLRLGVAQKNAVTLSGVSAYLFKLTFLIHMVGFVISVVGTRALMTRLGEKICLLLIPTASGIALLYFVIETSPNALMFAFVGLKAVHYAFSWPVRESLYIPTAKAVKFKSKSWIDAFGAKLAKSSGAGFNSWFSGIGGRLLTNAHSFFFAAMITTWLCAAYLLGRRFERAVDNEEVIGSEE